MKWSIPYTEEVIISRKYRLNLLSNHGILIFSLVFLPDDKAVTAYLFTAYLMALESLLEMSKETLNIKTYSENVLTVFLFKVLDKQLQFYVSVILKSSALKGCWQTCAVLNSL